jgi:photosystem II stability/assembly factor-like uncharacterized protein
MVAYNRNFLFALLVAMFMVLSVSAQNASVTKPAVTPSSSPTDQPSAGNTISSSVALFGALIVAAMFSI